LPFVFVLLDDKSRNSYVYMLNQLVAKYRELGLNFCPIVIVAEYEFLHSYSFTYVESYVLSFPPGTSVVAEDSTRRLLDNIP
jgi:hypothetical protein